jgi:hypothetical protein
MDEEWSTVRKVTRGLRDAMRSDLGLGPDEDSGRGKSAAADRDPTSRDRASCGAKSRPSVP